jgi:hypothetical protein
MVLAVWLGTSLYFFVFLRAFLLCVWPSVLLGRSSGFGRVRVVIACMFEYTPPSLKKKILDNIRIF